MLISMRLIENYLKSRKGVGAERFVDRSKGKTKYHSLRLINQHISVMQPNVLYIGTSDQVRTLKEHRKSGLVVIGQAEDIVCDVLEFPQTADISQVLNCLITIFEHFNRWESRLNKAVTSADQVGAILSVAQEEIHHPMYVVDSGYKVLGMSSYLYEMEDMSATWHYLSEYGYMPMDILMNLNRSKELQRKECINHSVRVESNYFYTPFINHAIFEKYEFLGHFFVIEIFDRLDEVVLELSNIVGGYIKDIISRSSTKLTSEFYESFLSDMLKSKPMDSAIKKRQMCALDWPEDAYAFIAYHESKDDSLMTLRSMAASLKGVLSCESLVRANNLTLIVVRDNLRDTKNSVEKLCRFANRTKIAFGVSDVFHGLDRLDIYYKQAVLSANSNRGKNVGVFRYRNYVKKDIITTLGSSKEPRIFCDPAILFLREYDAEKKFSYCKTIKTYLLCERHLVKTAELLDIHRNTLLYRLEKIVSLTDIDFDDHERRKRLILTFDILEEESSTTPK